MVLSLVDDQVQTQPLLSLPDEAPVPHSPDYIDGEAAKMHLTLGNDSPGVDVLKSAALSGNSDRYKALLADKSTIDDIRARNDVLQKISSVGPESINQDMIDVVHGLSNSQIQSKDLGDILEKEYSKKYTNVAAASLDNGVLDDAMKANPSAAHEMLDRTQTLSFKQNYAMKALDSANEDVKNQSYLGAGYNIAENMILGRYQKYDQVKEPFVSSVLPGQNLQQQYEYLWGLSNPDEFKQKFDAAVNDLKSRNPYTAREWLQGFFSYGNTDAAMENINAGIDIASVLPLGKLSQALKGVVRGAAKNPLRLYEVATDLGKFPEAGIGKIVEDMKVGKFLDGPEIKNAKDLEASVPSLSTPNRMMSGAEKLPVASYNRLADALIQRADLAQRFLADPTRIDRLLPEELTQYKDILRDEYIRQNPSIQKNVIDVQVPDKADLGNVYQAKVVLGQRDGSLFESEKQAEGYFKRYIGGTNDYKVVQNGDGFQIEIPKAVDESKIFDQVHLATTQKTPESLANTFNSNRWTQLRSADYVVSPQQVQARATVTSQHELLGQIVDQMAEPFRKLNKGEVSDLEDLMIQNREKQEYYENFSDFNDAFYKRFNRAPSEAQTDAYFAYVQLNDLDLVVRDLDWYKQKARMGLENHTVRVNGQDKAFEGKVIDRLPYGSKDPFSVATIDKDGKISKPKSSRFMSEKDRKVYDDLVKDGYKIVQVADQNFEIGEGAQKTRAGYLVTKNLKRDQVGVKNVDRRPGGHKVYKYPWYIKQGRISADEDSAIYLGDKTVFNFTSEKDARSFLDTLETARKKFAAGEPDALKYVRDNLPISTRRFVALLEKGELDKNVPFTVTKSGVKTINTGAYQGYKNLRDLTKSEHNLSSKISGSYAGERSVTDMPTVQSEGNLMFEIQPASFLSPLDTLRQSTANMISVQSMNDYTMLTRDNFLREFSDVLKGTTEEQKATGFALLQNPEFKPGIDKLNPSKVAAAKNVSRAFNQLMNSPTTFDRQVEFYKEKLLKGIADKFGPRGQEWYDRRYLGKLKSPGTFMKSVAFDMKLGLFNLQQVFIQANSAVNIMAISGKQGLQGVLAYPFVRAAVMTANEDVLKGVAKSVEKTGIMKADDFLESMKWYKNSGFNIVGGDVSYLDNLRSPDMKQTTIGGGVKKVLSWGRTPFQEGERVARISAWNAAYLERKAAVNGAELTRRDAQVILSRAKDLAGNMFRESNAAWQKGYASMLTQFFGYQARIMEQFLGKKLTPLEKARLFTGYSIVYGVPTAIGSAVGVLPIRDIIRDQMYQMGVDPDQDGATTYMDGMATEMTKLIFGREYNISSRFGPGGLTTFYDLWRGDKDLRDTLLGASGSIIGQTIMDSVPMLQGMISEFSDINGGYYNLTKEDFLAPLRNISTVDNALKLYHVWNFGIWASKHGVDITKMDLPDALVATITGLQPSEIENSFSQLRATQAFKDDKDALQKQIVQDYRKIMNMPVGPERDKMVRDLRARMTIGGMTLSEQAQTWKYAAEQEMTTDAFFQKYEEMKIQKDNARKGLK